MSGTLAITMAGMGSRFAKAGYRVPKYEIEVLGRPLFDWSMLSLEAYREAGWRFAFAIREETNAAPYIAQRCAVLGIDLGPVVSLDHLTDGQATTAKYLADVAAPEAPFAVYNIDTFVAPGAMRPPAPGACAGWIPCFPAPGDGWSFARLDASGQVVELREKQRISDHATVGLYGFETAAEFLRIYEAWFARPDAEEKGERYIAPMYNLLIEEGARVVIEDLALGDVGMLGTPDQVEAFRDHPPAGAQALVR